MKGAGAATHLCTPKATTNLIARCAEDLVYVYTNSKNLDRKTQQRRSGINGSNRRKTLILRGLGTLTMKPLMTLTENMEATGEMEWGVAAKLHERNTYYDANQYKLENWQDLKFPNYSVCECNEDTTEDWEDITDGEMLQAEKK